MSKRKTYSPPAVDSREGYSSYTHGQTLPASWSQETYAKWFFDFLRTDLTTLTPGQQLGMRADSRAFMGPAEVERTTPAAGVENMPALLDESLHPTHREGRAAIQAQLPTVEMLQQVQREAREGIQRVREGKRFELEEGFRYGIARRGDHIYRTLPVGPFRVLFLAAVMDVVRTHWPRLRECPQCRALFLKSGKRKYCSTVCGNRAHWDAFVKAHADRSQRDHHQEYARRIQKKLGPKVKARRRK